MQAAAVAGCTPSPSIMGTSRVPTVAAQPAALMTTMLISQVIKIAPGTTAKRTFCNGLVKRYTRLDEHFVYSITALKPMQAQMVGTSDSLISWEINACMAPSKQPSTPAIPAIRAMAAPERIRTILASRFFKIAAKVIKTISAPAQTIKYLLKI